MRTHRFILGFFGALLLWTTAIWAAGAWQGTAVIPWEYQSNYWYHSADMTPSGVTNANTIYPYVSWQYSLSNNVSGQIVYLCVNNGGSCKDITGLGSGTTNIFNGQTANQNFRFYVMVSRSGTVMFNPLAGGGQGQIYVNWQ